MTTKTSAGAGVYGLEITGLGNVHRYADPASPGLPRVEIRREIGTASEANDELYEDRAVIKLIEDGVLEIAKQPTVAVYRVPRALSDEEMLHPWLVPAAAMVNAWHGRRVLHGGLVSLGARAVAVVGDKEAGKSTLLAWMALATELRVMSDDLVVLEGSTAFCGPRCIDLREGSVAHLPPTVGATLVRDGTRLRLPLPASPPSAELVGIVVLRWGAQASLEPVRPSARLGRLLPHGLAEGLPLGADGVMGYAGYPVWDLTRPQQWESLQTSAQLVIDLLS